MRFEVLGPPQGKSRPRVCFKAGRAWAYTPKDTRDYEAKIKKAARGGKKLSGNVWMRISAVFPIPKSATKSKREEKEARHGQHHQDNNGRPERHSV